MKIVQKDDIRGRVGREEGRKGGKGLESRKEMGKKKMDTALRVPK